MNVVFALTFALAAAKAVGPAAPPSPPPPPAAQCPEPAPPARPTTVKVMLPDLEVKGRFASTRDTLGQIVAEQASAVRGYDILSAAEVRAVLSQEANKQLVGCEQDSCLAEIAAALDADLLVTGRVEDTPDGSTLVSLALVNVRAIVALHRVTVAWRGADDALPAVVRTSAQLLLLPKAARHPGGITVTGAPDDARVFVDGVERTADHRAGGVRGLEVGVHQVDVEAPDRIPLTTWVVVESDTDAVVPAALEQVPVPAVWLWVGGAAAVLGGAALTGAALYFTGKGDVALAAEVPALRDVEAVRSIGK